MDEVWVPVVGFEEHYEVSNTGFVRSIDRFVTFQHYQKESKQFHLGKILKFDYDRRKYRRVALVVNSKNRKFLVHRLVAMCFLSNTGNLPEVNHLDGNKHNNHVLNLEWCTTKQNRDHAKLLGLNHINRSLNFKDQVKAIRMFKTGLTCWKISKIFGCAPGSIRTYVKTGPKLNHSEK